MVPFFFSSYAFYHVSVQQVTTILEGEGPEFYQSVILYYTAQRRDDSYACCDSALKEDS